MEVVLRRCRIQRYELLDLIFHRGIMEVLFQWIISERELGHVLSDTASAAEIDRIAINLQPCLLENLCPYKKGPSASHDYRNLTQKSSP